MVMVVGAALLAGPQPGAAITSWSPMDGYQAELKRQCPDKQLFRLGVQDLRTLLQAFRATLPAQAQAEIEEAQAVDCSAAHNAYAAACENSAAVDAITRGGRLPPAVAFVCAAYQGCSDQSDCTAVP